MTVLNSKPLLEFEAFVTNFLKRFNAKPTFCYDTEEYILEIFVDNFDNTVVTDKPLFAFNVNEILPEYLNADHVFITLSNHSNIDFDMVSADDLMTIAQILAKVQELYLEGVITW